MEGIILSALEFNFTVPSALRFSERFSKQLGLNENACHLYHYLLQLALQHYKFLTYTPSILASAALYLVMNAISNTNGVEHMDADVRAEQYDAEVAGVTGYSIDQLREAITDMYSVWEQLNNSKYKAVQRKFTKKYNAVATVTLNKPSFL